MQTSKFEVGLVRHTDNMIDPYDSDKERKLKSIEIAAQTMGTGEQAIRAGLEVASLVSDDNRNRMSWNNIWRNALAIDFQDYQPVMPNVAAGLGTAANVLILMERRIKQGKVSPEWLSFGKGISGELAHTILLGDWSAGEAIDTLFRQFPDSEEFASTGFRLTDRHEDKLAAPKHYKLRVGGGEDGLPHYVGFNRLRAAADLVSPRGDHYDIVKRASFVINLARLEIDMREHLNDALHQPPNQKLWNELGRTIVEPAIEDKEVRAEKSVRPGSIVYFALRRNSTH